MENIFQRVLDDFEDINKISSILKCDYEFDPPASSEEISNWKKKITLEFLICIRVGLC